MTRHGEGRSVNSTSPAKNERSKRQYLIKKGVLQPEERTYLSINHALEMAGLL